MRASATITDSVARTQVQLDKQIEHSVDREEYLRRDREIQHALERMATKDELRDVNRHTSLDSGVDLAAAPVGWIWTAAVITRLTINANCPDAQVRVEDSKPVYGQPQHR